MITKETLDTLIGLGAKAPTVLTADGAEPLVALPSGQSVKSLAEFYPPTRIKQKVTLLEAGSFTDTSIGSKRRTR